MVGTEWRTSPSTAVRNRLAEDFGHRVFALYHDVATAISESDLLRLFSLGLSQEQSVCYPST